MKLKDIYELFGNDQIEEMFALVLNGYCHLNSFALSAIYGFSYCEGFYLDGGCKIHHAFNKMDNNYFDITTAKYYPQIKDVEIVREYTAEQIKDIFCREKKIFITFQGYPTKEGIIKYNDMGQRVMDDVFIWNGKDIGKKMMAFEKLKAIIGCKDNPFDEIMQNIELIKNHVNEYPLQ